MSHAPNQPSDEAIPLPRLIVLIVVTGVACAFSYGIFYYLYTYRPEAQKEEEERKAAMERLRMMPLSPELDPANIQKQQKEKRERELLSAWEPIFDRAVAKVPLRVPISSVMPEFAQAVETDQQYLALRRKLADQDFRTQERDALDAMDRQTQKKAGQDMLVDRRKRSPHADKLTFVQEFQRYRKDHPPPAKP
jgi:hypothetical protein